MNRHKSEEFLKTSVANIEYFTLLLDLMMDDNIDCKLLMLT
jgi:hypothetical protein